jgi:hypothetical protein
MKKRKREIQEDLLGLDTLKENGALDEEQSKKKVELFNILGDEELC